MVTPTPRDIPPGNTDRTREEVRRLMGLQGDLLDQAITRRMAIAAGIMTDDGRFTGLGGGSPGPAGAPGPAGPPGTSPTPDFTPPPTVTGLAALSAITHVLVTWDAATYTQGHGHLQTNIYAVQRNPGDPLPTFSDAVLVYEATGALTIAALPSEPNIRWHIWAKWKTADGVESVSPAGGTNGVQATTGQDVTHLLTVLTGQITTSQLASALNTRINLVDAPSTTPGSVDARILTETNARTSADSAMASQITTLSSTVNSTAAPFEPYQTWEFVGAAEGWIGSGVTLATGGEAITLTSTGADPQFISPPVSITGSRYDKIRARVMRTAGSGWDGTAFYGIPAGHSFSTSFRKTVTPDPTVLNQWVIVEWDMAVLTVGGNDWAVSTINQLRLDLGATSSDVFIVDWVTVGRRSVGLSQVTMQQEISTRATETGFLSGLYSVRTQVTQGGRTVVGGFGLSGTSSPTAGPTIDFGVVANKFWVAAPAGTPGVADVLPFVIQTTPQTVNGVVIPAGVYMDAAFINNLTAMYARFGTLVADSIAAGQINAANLTLGDGHVGGTLKSSGFVSGLQGWRLQPDGTAELQNANVRGTVNSTNGNFDGTVTIRDSIGGGIVFQSGGNLDWTRVAGTTRPRFFRAVAAGLNAILGGGLTAGPGLYDETGTLVHGGARSYMLARVRLSDGVVTFTQYYDVFSEGTDNTVPGFGRGSAALAADLNATANTHVAVLYTHDEPSQNRTANGLPAAVYRCGGSPGVFGKAAFKSRSAYILVGIGGCGQGNGYEQYRGDFDNDVNAVCDMGFAVQNGRLITSGTATPPQIDSGNVSTYIANAAIQDAQIGSLHASKIVAGSITATQIQAQSIGVNELTIGAFTGNASTSSNIWNVAVGTSAAGTVTAQTSPAVVTLTRQVAGSVLDCSIAGKISVLLKSSFGGPAPGNYDVVLRGWAFLEWNGGASLQLIGDIDERYSDYCDAFDAKVLSFSTSNSFAIAGFPSHNFSIKIGISDLYIIPRVAVGGAPINAVSSVQVLSYASICERKV